MNININIDIDRHIHDWFKLRSNQFICVFFTNVVLSVFSVKCNCEWRNECQSRPSNVINKGNVAPESAAGNSGASGLILFWFCWHNYTSVCSLHSSLLAFVSSITSFLLAPFSRIPSVSFAAVRPLFLTLSLLNISLLYSVLHSSIQQSVSRQVQSLYQSHLSTQCDLQRPPSNECVLSFP